MPGGWEGFGSGVVGGIAGFIGDSSAAAASARQARESRAWQRAENITNREFQERMTRNRYGYQMEDMRTAGLNPILAFQNSPPGSPPGASGGGGAMGQVNPRMGTDAINTALATLRNKEEVRKLGAEADLTEWSAAKAKLVHDAYGKGQQGFDLVDELFGDAFENLPGAGQLKKDWQKLNWPDFNNRLRDIMEIPAGSAKRTYQNLQHGFRGFQRRGNK